MKKVIVLGGGASGYLVAKYLSGFNPFCKVILVDRNSPYLLNLQVKSGDTWFSNSFLRSVSSGLGSGVKAHIKISGCEFVQNEILDVDVNSRKVQLGGSRVLQGDALVFALGARNMSASIQASGFLYSPWEMRDYLALPGFVKRLAREVGQKKTGRSVIGVVGGGIQGVSFALFLQDLFYLARHDLYEANGLWKVVIFEKTGSLCHLNSEGTRKIVSMLREKGIEVRLHRNFKAMDSQDMVFENGSVEKQCAFAFWAAGSNACEMVMSFNNRQIVDSAFQVRGKENVFCVGDQAIAPILHRLPSKKSLKGEAMYVAHAVLAKLQNRLLPTYTPKETHVDIPFGRLKSIRISKGEARIRFLV